MEYPELSASAGKTNGPTALKSCATVHELFQLCFALFQLASLPIPTDALSRLWY